MNSIVEEIKSQSQQNSTTTLDKEKKEGGDLRISTHKVDVSSAVEIGEMLSQIEKEHGQLPDILISNAGYGRRVPQIWDISLEEFDYTINVNLRASFILVKGVVEHMKNQRWGRIVFMSSVAAFGGGVTGCSKLCLLNFGCFFFFFFFFTQTYPS